MKYEHMTKEELFEAAQKPFKTSNGILVTKHYSENGEDFNTLLQNYFKKMLTSGKG